MGYRPSAPATGILQTAHASRTPNPIHQFLGVAYLQARAPPVYDPFSGGGSIPLEAQRLGLRAYGSDLNPVAVLIGKALVEIPPKFAGLPPVNPKAQAELKRGGKWNGNGAQGLAEDVRYYGQWMRDEAERRVGNLYPKAKLPDGSEATVIAWLWARTVRSPDPAAKGAMVPLVSSFMLATKAPKKAWVEPIVEHSAQDGWRFEVNSGEITKTDEKRLSQGTKSARATFRCILTGANIGGAYIDAEAQAGQMGARLMAVVVEGAREKLYLSPTELQEHGTLIATRILAERGDDLDLPQQQCRGTYASNALGRRYSFRCFADYFTPRQLVALTTFSTLIGEARERALADALVAHLANDHAPLSSGGLGATAYADAVSTYLAFANSRMADRHSSLTRWDPNPTGYAPKIANTFSRQAVAMTWDYAEGNPFSGSSGNFEDAITWVKKNVEVLGRRGPGAIFNTDAASNSFSVRPIIISTDPPYYNNIGYADLSDFFYVWLRRSLQGVWPDLFRRLTTPKDQELIATPYRHGSNEEAEAFFMRGMSDALRAMRQAATDSEPLAIYYAFKQSEVSADGVTSAGWASFLQAVVDSGLTIDGTWPVRTELSNRLVGKDANALASSVVLVCRKRSAGASVVTRAELIRVLKRELPDAIDDIRKAGVGPVDMQQSVIGPGMGLFTRYAKVLESDDSHMSVRTALMLINRVWEEIENELDANFDPETQVALAWYGSYGYEAKKSGELNVIANAKNVPEKALFDSRVFNNLHGNAALTPRAELPLVWSPATDKHLTVWRCVQQVARVLKAEEGGGDAAAKVVAQMGPRAADAQKLAYRLFEIATRKGLNEEALIYNELAQEWAKLEDLAASAASSAPAIETQAAFQF